MPKKKKRPEKSWWVCLECCFAFEGADLHDSHYMECGCGEQCIRLSELIKGHLKYLSPKGHPDACALRATLKEVREGNVLSTSTPYGEHVMAVVSNGWSARANDAIRASEWLERGGRLT